MRRATVPRPPARPARPGGAGRPWAAALALALAGCGGGLYIGIGDGGDFDDPPSVALTASATSLRGGQPLTLAAAASDDFGIDSVAFYRIEADGQFTRLGSDGQPPYTWDTVLPGAAPGTVVRYFARAQDSGGQRTDSAPVEVTVQ